MNGQSRPLLLVTGAAGGIGSAAARLAAERGWDVEGWDARAPEAPSSTGVETRAVDVSDPDAVAAAADELEARRGPVAGLLHAAGIHAADDALAPDPGLWQRLFAVNTLGTVAVCSAVGARMARRGRGAIVAVTSNAAHTPRVAMPAYAASKAAAASYVRSLALTLAPAGVRCNAVSPGSTLTPMITSSWDDADAGRRALLDGRPDEYRLGIPLGRVAEPDDVARACLWLLSDEARHVTLHDLRVDGGATLDGR